MPSRKIRRSPLSQYLDYDGDHSFSESSTQTADTENRKERRRRYHVKFDMSATKKYPRSPIDDNELNKRWYSSKDNDKMKESSFSKAREFGKQDQKTRGNATLHAILGKLLDACLKAKEDTGKNLLKRKDFAKLCECLSSPDRLGLETAINTDLMADKLNRRYNILRNVMAEQGGKGAGIHDLLRGPSDSREISQISEKFSLASRLLARHLAQASAGTY